MSAFLKILNNLIDNGFEFFGRYYSSYRGFVVDNADPKSFGRLKLRIPEITGAQSLEYWAWPTNVFSGKSYGMQVIPQVGDMVWVEFEKGDPRKPIWKHGHFSNNNADGLPEKDDDLKDIKNFWFKTPYGHVVEFDDTNLWVRVKTKEGHILILDDTNKLVKVNTKDGHYIEMNDDSKILSISSKEGHIVKLDDDANEVKITHKDGQELVMSDSDSVFNGGSNDGLVKVGDLVSKLNAVENDLNTLKTVFSAWVPVPSDGGAALKTASATWFAATITPTVQNDLENTEVKH